MFRKLSNFVMFLLSKVYCDVHLELKVSFYVFIIKKTVCEIVK